MEGTMFLATRLVSRYGSKGPAPAWLGPITRLCLSLIGIGAVWLFVGNETFSSFNATTTNPANTFASGALLMTNNGTSPCTSVASGSNCGTLILSSNTGMSPGDIATGTISITNLGAAATMTLTGNLNASLTTNSLNSYLNLTVYDNSTATCVYGHSSVPYTGACDNLTGLTAQATTDAFPATTTGALSLPGIAGATWAAGETHAFTVTAEVIAGSGIPTASSAAVDFQWNGVSAPGSAH